MAHFKSVSFLALFTWSCIFPMVFCKELFAKTGEDVILPCPVNQTIGVFEWTRSDLKSPQYVFFYRSRRSDLTQQHPSFKNRVELRDEEMKNRDLTLILKNVRKSDSGTYECRIVAGGARLWKRASNLLSDPISIIRLQVLDRGPEGVTAYPGQDVSLTCQSINRDPVAAVEWTRSDLEPLEYVFFHRDGHSDRTHQHPSFKNRVELRDGEMKNGDLTLILKKVTEDDRGTYECRIITDGTRRGKRAVIPSDPISIINLEVSDGMDQQEHKDLDPEGPAGPGLFAVAVIVPLAVAAVIIAAGFWIYRKQRQHEKVPILI